MKFPDTQFIRAIGILLIVNSHLDNYYPVKQLATGGAIGNSIFFFLSAFGICLSQQNKNRPFKEFMTDRISRIYPSMWLVLLSLTMPLMLFSGRLSADSATKFIGNFFNPPFWFLQALLVYYILSFSFTRPDHHGNIKKNGVLIFAGFLCLIYFLLYFTWVDLNAWSVEKSPFDLIHYFIVFLFGIFIAQRNEAITYTGPRNYLAILAILFLVYTHKYLMTKGILLDLQFIQQAAMYPLVYYLLKVSRSPLILKGLTQIKGLAPTVNFLSGHTLEIYMIHETLNRPVLHLGLEFPMNIILFLILTFSLASLVKKLSESIMKRINNPITACAPGN